jgi:histidyl-tRNA synthetase
VLTRFGYHTVETPLIEYADLFLVKSGDEAINRLFTFELYGRQLCLRSEFTASAARMYVERYQHAPKPIRWQFNGPVFRYESPGKGHSRQFTMIGAELLGMPGALGDAEIISMAIDGLRTIGLEGWQLTIGHVGLIAQVLERFELDRRTRRLLVGQVENLRRPGRGRPFVEAQYEQMIALNPSTQSHAGPARQAASEKYSAEMAGALELLFESANLGTVGTGRTNEDVARRLLTKQQRAEQRGEVHAALDFLEQITSVSGTPAETLPTLERLLQPDPAANAILQQFKSGIALLDAYGIRPDQITIELGLARGVNYYTGVVFEVLDGSGSQLCGGGRYDDFIRTIGASQDTPAVGFMYSLDRIMESMASAETAAGISPVQALVVPVDEDDSLMAIQVATRLRQRINVELYPPPNRGGSRANEYAGKQGIPYVLFVGARERESQSVSIRTIATGAVETRPLAALDAFLDEVSR